MNFHEFNLVLSFETIKLIILKQKCKNLLLFQLSSLLAQLNKLATKKLTPSQPLVSVSVPHPVDAKNNKNLLLLMPTGDGYTMSTDTTIATPEPHGIQVSAQMTKHALKSVLLMESQLMTGRTPTVSPVMLKLSNLV